MLFFNTRYNLKAGKSAILIRTRYNLKAGKSAILFRTRYNFKVGKRAVFCSSVWYLVQNIFVYS